MTGFGEAHVQQDGLAVAVEVRADQQPLLQAHRPRDRGLCLAGAAGRDEVRAAVHRGTIQVNLRIDRRRSPDDYRINVDVLDRYRQQLESLRRQWEVTAARVARGPVAVAGRGRRRRGRGRRCRRRLAGHRSARCKRRWRTSAACARRGRAMAADLTANCRLAAASLDQIERRARLVVEEYRTRLYDRLKRTLAELDVALDPAEVIKEVSLFADRSDISEEIVRLRSHLEQFQAIMELPESAGRKLEFLTQEMFREANTIGSKANDVEIARSVIEIKTAIERIREMIQNIE